MNQSKRKVRAHQGVLTPVETPLDTLKGSLFDTVVAQGLGVFRDMLEAEVAEICGERYRHIPGRKFRRWGKGRAMAAFDGRKITVEYNRVRNPEERREIRPSSLEQFHDIVGLLYRHTENMIVGVSTRKMERSLPAPPANQKTYGSSKSAVSRNFIALTEKRLQEWMTRPLTGDYCFLMIDGVRFQGDTVIVALGITYGGEKEVLGLRHGATENARVCIDLLRELVERGLRTDRIQMATIDGSKALRASLEEVIGESLPVQRCQEHKKRNVLSYLPDTMQQSVRMTMNQAYVQTDEATALQLLEKTARSLDRAYPSAAASLREGMAETVTVLRLKMPPALRHSLSSTNIIENVMGGVRLTTGRVRRWRGGNMVMRWVCAALLESQKGFRRIRGYKEVGKWADIRLDKSLDNVEKSA